MSRKCILTITIFILSSFYSFGQSAKMRGIAIMQSGDTLKGYFELLSPVDQATICKYKMNEHGEDWKIHNPNEIISYRLENGQKFVSRFLNASVSESPIFIEHIVNGPLKLYSYTNENGFHYLVEKDSLGLREITKELKNYFLNGREYVSSSNLDDILLCYYTKEYPELGKSIRNIKMVSRTNLSYIVIRYNSKMGDKSSYEVLQKTPFKRRISIQPFGGFIVLRKDLNLTNRIIPTYGIAAEFGILDFKPNLYFRTGILLSSLEERQWEEVGYYRSEWTKKANLVIIPLEIQYVSSNRFGYVLGGGINFTTPVLGPFININGNAGLKFEFTKRTCLRLSGYLSYYGDFLIIPDRIAYYGINLGVNIKI